jgi:hypothetical protein
MAILLVGVLGVLTVLSTSAQSTRSTTAREQGTNLARDLVERSRQIPYAQTSMSAAPGALRAALPASDAPTSLSDGTFDVTRRGVRYTVRISACSIDDPADGAGIGDATFCAAPTSGTGTGPGTNAPGPAAAVNVLGVAVTATGSLLTTVCNAVGTGSAVLGAVSSLATSLLSVAGASIQVCPGAGSGSVALDTDTPDDLRRVRVDVSWSRGGPGRVSQTTLITNPDQA